MRNIVASVSLSLLLTACAHRSPLDVPPDAVRDDMPTCEQFVATHDFPYVAPRGRHRRVREGYSRLSLGLSKAEVVALLGNPDCSKLNYTKGPPPFRYLGSGWTYWFEKLDPGLTNSKTDKAIQIFFGVDGRTHWIVSNVEGLKEIGTPERRDNQPERELYQE